MYSQPPVIEVCPYMEKPNVGVQLLGNLILGYRVRELLFPQT